MSRAAWIGLLLVAGCPEDEPITDDTDTAVVVPDTYETGLWPETDTDPWDDTADTDTDFETDTDILDTDVVACPAVAGVTWVLDCNGDCASPVNIGDGFCDHGPAPKIDFDCLEHDFDGGDCIVDTAVDTALCPFPGEVPDCNGSCFAGFLIGDGTCHEGPAPLVDFSCETFSFDGGDCVADTGPDTDVDTDTGVDTDVLDDPCPFPLFVRDCNGRCYPENWLGDAMCDDGSVHPYGRPDFDCDRLSFDEGDCTVAP